MSRYDLSDLHSNTMESHVIIEEDMTYVPTNIYEDDLYIGMWWGQYMTTDFSWWGVRFLVSYIKLIIFI